MPKKSAKKSAKKSTKKSAKKPLKKSSKKPLKKSSKEEFSTTTPKVEVVPVTELYDNESVYCQFNVSDYAKSIKFYSEVLEWKPSKLSESTPDPDTIGWYEFQLPVKGAFLGLGKAQDGSVTPSRSLVISVKNLEQFKQTMVSKEANPSEITDVPNMISYLTINDPDNNSIMFISEPRVKS